MMDAQTGTRPRRKPLVDQIFGDNKAPIAEVLDADFAQLRHDIEAMVERMRAQAKTPPKTDEDQAALGRLLIEARAVSKLADGQRETEKKPILDAGRALDGWFKDTLAPLLKGADFLQGQADAYVRQKAAEERARREREAAELRRKEEEARQKEEAAKTAAGAARAGAQAEAAAAKAEEAEAAAAAATADLVRSRVDGVTASAKGTWTATITDYTAAISPLGPLGPYLKREAVEAALTSMVRIQKDAAVWPGVAFRQVEKATFR